MITRLPYDFVVAKSITTPAQLKGSKGAIGGFGAHVLHTLSEHGLLERAVKVRSMVLPDLFIDQDSPAGMYARARLDAKGIVAKVFEALGDNLRGEALKLGRA